MEPSMSFAESQMAKYGWKEGQGLGREEKGMTEAIKVKLKFDNAGFGHDRAEEFTFQWWDHIFNKAAENISVSKNEKGGIELQRKEELVVTKSRPSVAATKEKLYGSFVKGGTLQGAEKCSTTDSSDESSDDNEPRDMSMTLSDDQLFKLCGGRTAHKGARHGMNMNAKLERVRLQEEELMHKWKSEAQQNNSSQLNTSMSNDIQDSGQGTPAEKKIKKKKHKEVVEESLSNTGYEKTNKKKYTCDEENTGEEERKKKKKKKKKNKHLEQDTMDDSGIESVEHEIKENKENTKKKKKQKEKEDSEHIEKYESKSNKKGEFEHKIEDQGQSKKKKSKKYNHENDKLTSDICESPDVTFKKKRKKDKLDFSEVELKKKIKKNKKSKEIDANVEDNYEENGIIDELNIISSECKEKKKKKMEHFDCSAIEVVEVKIKKKKKSKKSKEREYEENASNFEKLSTNSIEIKEKKKKKTNEIIAPETEIRDIKKKRKSKSIDDDIQTISNLENKSSKKKKKKDK